MSVTKKSPETGSRDSDFHYFEVYCSLLLAFLTFLLSCAVLIPPGSTTKVGWRCTRGRPDGIPGLMSSVSPLKPCLPLMPPGVQSE